MTVDLGSVGSLLGLKELELDALGYPEAQVQAAIRWAYNSAAGVAEKAPLSAQETVFLALLSDNLAATERFMSGSKQAAREGDQARGLDRAARERLPERGYERMGVDGRAVAGKWRRAVPANKAGYARFWGD